MACGDAANSWVPSLVGSIWSGTVGTDSLVAVFTSVAHVAAVTVGTVPGVGTWSKDTNGFHFNVALEGFTWQFDVIADSCNVNGDVSAAVGNAVDGNDIQYNVAMTRSV